MFENIMRWGLIRGSMYLRIINLFVLFSTRKNDLNRSFTYSTVLVSIKTKTNLIHNFDLFSSMFISMHQININKTKTKNKVFMTEVRLNPLDPQPLATSGGIAYKGVFSTILLSLITHQFSVACENHTLIIM